MFTPSFRHTCKPLCRVNLNHWHVSSEDSASNRQSLDLEVLEVCLDALLYLSRVQDVTAASNAQVAIDVEMAIDGQISIDIDVTGHTTRRETFAEVLVANGEGRRNRNVGCVFESVCFHH